MCASSPGKEGLEVEQALKFLKVSQIKETFLKQEFGQLRPVGERFHMKEDNFKHLELS